MESQHSHPLPWTLEDIALEQICENQIYDREDLFFLLTAGSFIEIASDVYARNLANHFDRDQEVTNWLIDHWEREEVQHGLALKTYVMRVWPEFNWDAAYTDFFEEISPTCTTEVLEPVRSLEMVARCVIEVGTATIYRAIHDYKQEPILRRLLKNIRCDELRHYKHFYFYFVKYNRTDRNGRLKVLAALRRRVLKSQNNRLECALRHAFRWRYPKESVEGERYSNVIANLTEVLRHYPTRMAIKMLLRLLVLPPSVRWCINPLAKLAQRCVNPLANKVVYRRILRLKPKPPIREATSSAFFASQ